VLFVLTSVSVIVVQDACTWSWICRFKTSRCFRWRHSVWAPRSAS